MWDRLVVVPPKTGLNSISEGQELCKVFSDYRAPTSRSSQFGDFCGFSSAAGENATHGKRRTNADKRAAVLRWLEDDEGKQWTDSHIAKMCHVSDPFVGKISHEIVSCRP